MNSLLMPVHGELGHKCNISLVCTGLVLIVQEVEVSAMHSETLSPELVTWVILIKFQQSLLELKHHKHINKTALKYIIYLTLSMQQTLDIPVPMLSI